MATHAVAVHGITAPQFVMSVSVIDRIVKRTERFQYHRFTAGRWVTHGIGGSERDRPGWNEIDFGIANLLDVRGNRIRITDWERFYERVDSQWLQFRQWGNSASNGPVIKLGVHQFGPTFVWLNRRVSSCFDSFEYPQRNFVQFIRCLTRTDQPGLVYSSIGFLRAYLA